MINKGIIGEQNASSGIVTLRAGRQGELMTSNVHGRFYEQVMRGNVFGASNQAATSTTAALATTFTGLAVANPSSSGKNLVMLRYTVGQVAAGAAGAVGLMVGSGAAAGSLTVYNRKVGASTSGSVTTASAGATIATPTLQAVFGNIGSLATTGYGLTPGLDVYLDGEIIVPPGFFIAGYTTAATTTALIQSMAWEEVPV